MAVGKLTVALLGTVTVCAGGARPQVTPQRLLDSAKEPQNWLMYSGDYAGHRYTTLDQVTSTTTPACMSALVKVNLKINGKSYALDLDSPMTSRSTNA